MTTGRVRAGFFHTRIRPVGLSLWPELDPLLTGFFSPGLDLPPPGPAGLVKPCQIWAQSTAQIMAQPKKKKKELNDHCPFLCTFFSF